MAGPERDEEPSRGQSFRLIQAQFSETGFEKISAARQAESLHPVCSARIECDPFLKMKYDWREAGEEWSQPWGSSTAQWEGTIFPRIRDCLPSGTILEIAPGFGRWTHYLKDQCQELWAVDKSSECIEACRQRFAGDSRVRCHLNDGRSLAMIPDSSIDFVFSFDSFVHPDRDIVEGYLRQLRTKLKIGAKGFIHHSNFGEYVNSPREQLPEFLAKPLIKAGILDWAHHRNPDMTAGLFRSLCAQNGLQCISQELVNWRGRRLIDCLSLFVRSDATQQNPTKIIRNPNFMREAARIRRQIGATRFEGQ